MKRERALARWACLATLVAATGCATPAREGGEATVLPVPALPDRASLPSAPPLPVKVIVPGPAAAQFVGGPLSAIEGVLGAPALVRSEGTTEFRRYDLGDCRAYVLALPQGGTVLSVETGASVQGAPEPRFEDCTATERFVGS